MIKSHLGKVCHRALKCKVYHTSLQFVLLPDLLGLFCFRHLFIETLTLRYFLFFNLIFKALQNCAWLYLYFPYDNILTEKGIPSVFSIVIISYDFLIISCLSFSITCISYWGFLLSYPITEGVFMNSLNARISDGLPDLNQ